MKNHLKRFVKVLSYICILTIITTAVVFPASAEPKPPIPEIPFVTHTIPTLGGSHSWEVPISSTPVIPKIDVMYLVDRTGSMAPAHTTLVDGLSMYTMEAANWVHYDKNFVHVIWAPTPVLYDEGETVIVEPGLISIDGDYNFVHWNTKPDGSGTAYNPGDTFIMPDEEVNLYAIWRKNGPNRVIYDKNLVDIIGTVPAAVSYFEGETVTVEPGLTSIDYNFVYWNTRADGAGISYNPGTTFTMPGEDVTLYAIWAPKAPNLVIYDKNLVDIIGTVPAAVSYFEGETVTVEPGLTSIDYNFVYWNTRADGLGTSYNPGDTFTMPDGEVILYAIWRAKAAPERIAKVTFNTPALTALRRGEERVVTFTPSPNDSSILLDGSGKYMVTWTSSNTSVATIDEDGRLIAVGIGNAAITLTIETVYGPFTAVFMVRVG